MIKKIKTIAILILMGIIAFLLFQGSTFLDSKLENKPHQWIKDEPTIAPVTQAVTETQNEIRVMVKEHVVEIPEINANSPEIVNGDYGWLQGAVKRCHPSMKSQLKLAISNDGVIRQNEYNAIMAECVDFLQEGDDGDKTELKRFLAE